jgi:transposase
MTGTSIYNILQNKFTTFFSRVFLLQDLFQLLLIIDNSAFSCLLEMYGPDLKRRAVELAYGLNLDHRKNECTIPIGTRQAAKLLGIQTHSSIVKWRQQMLTDNDIKDRLSLRGRKKKLNEKDEEKIIHWAKRRRLAKEPVKIRHVIEKAKSFHVDLKPYDVSRMMARNGMSKRRIKKVLKKKLKPEFSTSIEQFREMIQKSRIPASKMLVMDEAGIWSDDISPYTYEEKGSKDVGVVVPDEKIRHTIVATLRGDGTALPPFWIQHQNANKKRKQKAVKGMNTMFMLKYIDEVLAPNKGDAQVILMDNLSCHHNGQVMEKIINLGLKLWFFPPNAATELSPCDNSFFREMRAIYRSMRHNTSKKMKESALKAYNLVRSKTIRSYFSQCELTLKHRRNL